MDRHGLAGARGFVKKVAEQRFTKSSAAPFRQQRDVDDVVPIITIATIEIEAADVCPTLFDHQKIRVGKTLPVFPVLGARLRLEKGGRLLLRPLQRRELVQARRGVDATQERLVRGACLAEADA